MIRVTKLCVTGYRAIGNICIEPDMLTVIVGPNASGKTSLLEALNRIRNLEAPPRTEVRRGFLETRFEVTLQAKDIRSPEIRSIWLEAPNWTEDIRFSGALASFAKLLDAETITLRIIATMPLNSLSSTTSYLDLSELEVSKDQVIVAFTPAGGRGREVFFFLRLLRSILFYIPSSRSVKELLETTQEFGQRLYVYYPRREVYERLVKWIKGIGRYTDMRVVPERENKLILEVYDGLAGAWVNAMLAAGGLQRALPILLLLATVEEGVIAIDDVELGLHPAAQVRLAEAIIETVKRGIQVILSTHSPVMLMALQLLVQRHKVEHAKIVVMCRDQRDVRAYETSLSLRGELPDEMVKCLEEMGAIGVFGEQGKLAMELAEMLAT